MDFRHQRPSSNFEDRTGEAPSLRTLLGAFLLRHGIINDASGHPYQPPLPPVAPSKPGDWPTVGTPGGDIDWASNDRLQMMTQPQQSALARLLGLGR